MVMGTQVESSPGDKAITWLHLSDLHTFVPTGWDARRLTESLIVDLKRLQRDAGLRPDFIVFSGDVAFGQIGNSYGLNMNDQYSIAADFLLAVRRAFTPEVPSSSVFIVPGNHDVNIRKIADQDSPYLRDMATLESVTKMIAACEVTWQRYMARLEDYRGFLERCGYDHLLADPQRLVSSHVVELPGGRCGIACLNSAWSCGLDTGKGQIWIGLPWQAETTLAAIPDVDVAIAVIHHPDGWLTAYEDEPLWRQHIQRRFDFCLHGHIHSPEIDERGNHVVVSAGACYERSDKPAGYNFVRLWLDRGRGECWLRKFDPRGSGWVADLVSGSSIGEIWPLKNIGGKRPARIGSTKLEGLGLAVSDAVFVREAPTPALGETAATTPLPNPAVTEAKVGPALREAEPSDAAASTRALAAAALQIKESLGGDLGKNLAEQRALEVAVELEQLLLTFEHEHAIQLADETRGWLGAVAGALPSTTRKRLYSVLARVAILSAETHSGHHAPDFTLARQLISEGRRE